MGEYGLLEYYDGTYNYVKSIGIEGVDSSVCKRLSDDEKGHILSVYDKKLDEYYDRIK